MKTILVPTDFSENAENALKYAIVVANSFGANIELVHSFHLSQKAGMFVSVQERMRIEAKKDLKKLLNIYQEKMTNNNEINFHLIRDYAPDGITNLARKYEADLIIMGTKGASALKGAIWGSIASKLISQTKIPVLAIPKYYVDFGLEKIVLAIDNPSFNDKKVLEPLRKIAKKANAKVTVFNMAVPVTAEGEDDYISTSDLIEDVADEYYQSFDNDLKHSIISYVMNNKADMICMIKKDRGFFNDLFRASSTKKIIFDSPVPLLILHQKENK